MTCATATFTIPAGQDDHPMSDVSLEGARAYCAWAGKALPTDAQWEYAALHDPVTGHDRRFPWGDRFEKARSNCWERRPCGDAFDGTSPVGWFDGTRGRKDGRSAIGAHDLYGNVSEWIEGCGEGGFQGCGECVDPRTSAECGRPVKRDGDASVFVDDAPSPSWIRISAELDITLMTGFRCVTTAAVARPAGAAGTPR